MEAPGEGTVTYSADFISDVVGDVALEGQRLPLGEILRGMDNCAIRVAQKHTKSDVKTVSMDAIIVANPILHGDLVKWEGRVVQVLPPSVSVQVRIFRKDLSSRSWQLVLHSFLTLTPPPTHQVPTLVDDVGPTGQLEQELQIRQELLVNWSAMLEGPVPENLCLKDMMDYTKREHVNVDETVLVLRCCLGSKVTSTNQDTILYIRSGDLLQWMDTAANQCSRTFVQHRRTATICVNRIVFKKPILVSDWVELVARVVYVRLHTMEVEVECWIDRDGTKQHACTGYFIVLQLNELGHNKEVLAGININEFDDDDTRRHYMAKQRFAFWQQFDSDLASPPWLGVS